MERGNANGSGCDGSSRACANHRSREDKQSRLQTLQSIADARGMGAAPGVSGSALRPVDSHRGTSQTDFGSNVASAPRSHSRSEVEPMEITMRRPYPISTDRLRSSPARSTTGLRAGLHTGLRVSLVALEEEIQLPPYRGFTGARRLKFLRVEETIAPESLRTGRTGRTGQPAPPALRTTDI